MRAPLARAAALALYPPSWRARYQDEVLAYLDDTGGGPLAVASLAWRALPAWFCPPRHLHDRPARMRASLSTALMSWSMLAGLGLVFAQLTQLQGLIAPDYPQVRWAYVVFDGSLALSALVAGVGGLPLWLLMLRRARREQRTRDTVYLLLPVIAPAAYLAGLAMTVRLVGDAQGVTLSWFVAGTLAGFAAAAIAAAGPGLALRRLQPRGPALRLAVTAAGVSAAIMAVAAAAIAVGVVSLCLWARQFSDYHNFTTPGIYLALVVIAATVTTVSAARGTRAALAGPSAGASGRNTSPAGGPGPARGLPAAEEAAPDRLVRPVRRTVAGSRLPRRRTARPVARTPALTRHVRPLEDNPSSGRGTA